jgi:hypothetical protein
VSGRVGGMMESDGTAGRERVEGWEEGQLGSRRDYRIHSRMMGRALQVPVLLRRLLSTVLVHGLEFQSRYFGAVYMGGEGRREAVC